jgi:hypothetical protein
MDPRGKTTKIDLIYSQLLKTPPYAIQTFSHSFGFPEVGQRRWILMEEHIACVPQD